MTREEKISQLLDGIIKVPAERLHPTLDLGPNHRVCIEQPDLDIKVQIGVYKSELKNYKLARLLIELAIEEKIK